MGDGGAAALDAREWLKLGPLAGVARPTGLSLYYDDPSQDIQIVALFDRCTHLCCYPGWHVAPEELISHNYTAPDPTYDVFRQDPVYCICHDVAYDPMVLEVAHNPRSNADYVGDRQILGPGFGPLPVIPIRAVEDVLEGGMADPRWYEYC